MPTYSLPKNLDNRFLNLLGIKDSIKEILSDQKTDSFSKIDKLDKLFEQAVLNRATEQHLTKNLISQKNRDILVSEAIIRPTGLLDPKIILKPVKDQVDDILEQIRQRVSKGQRVLVTTLTKRFAEELDLYLKQLSIKSAYIHSDVDTLERLDILADLRRGQYDVLIGINLLREGLDLPEVSLVAIFDADKEGFLRSRTSLVQIIGRAARHVEGTVIMYADTITGSMKLAISETERRRSIQETFNNQHGIIPKSTIRKLETISDKVRENKEAENEGVDSKQDEWSFENKNARGGKYLNRSGGKSTNRQKYDPGKQLYADFEQQKQIELQTIKATKMSRDDLLAELELAVDQMNFEKAAAIRDLLKS